MESDGKCAASGNERDGEKKGTRRRRAADSFVTGKREKMSEAAVRVLLAHRNSSSSSRVRSDARLLLISILISCPRSQTQTHT